MLEVHNGIYNGLRGWLFNDRFHGRFRDWFGLGSVGRFMFKGRTGLSSLEVLEGCDDLASDGIGEDELVDGFSVFELGDFLLEIQDHADADEYAKSDKHGNAERDPVHFETTIALGRRIKR